MGFLDNLLKNSVKKIAGETIDKVMGDTFDEFTQAGKSILNTATANSSSQSHSSRELSLPERIEKVCANQFPEYEVNKNVDSSICNADPAAWKYSYTLSRDGVLKLTILVLYDKNDYKRKAVRLAHEASEQMNVHCINIMDYLPSTEEYITNAIASHI